MFTLNANTNYCCSAPVVPAARVPAAALLTILGLAAPDPTRMDGAYTEQPRSEA